MIVRQVSCVWLIASVFLSAIVSAQVQWDGSCGGASWHAVCGPGNSLTNWSHDMLPASGDMVVIPQGAPTVSIVGALGIAQTINCQSGLSIASGGQLGLAGAGGSIKNLTLSNASVHLQTTNTLLELQGSSSSIGGTIIGPGSLVNVEGFTGQSLGLQGAGAQFQNFGQASFTTITCPINTIVNNFGMLTVSSGTFGGGLISNGVFNNNVGGTFITQHTNMPQSFVDIQPFFNLNNGTFRVIGPSTSLGTRIHNGGNLSGQIEVLNNANLRFEGVGGSAIYHLNNVSMTGEGNVWFQLPNFNSYRVYIDAPVTANLTGAGGGLVLNSGVMSIGDANSGDAVFTNQGKALWQAMRIERCAECFFSRFSNTSADFILNTGAASNSVVLDALFINEAGSTFNHNQGRLMLGNHGVMNNAGLYRLVRGDIAPVSSTTQGAFTNAGVLIKPNDPATLDSTISAPFDVGTGVVLVDSHTLTFSSGALKFNGNGNVAVGQNAQVVLIGGMHRALAGHSTVDGLGEFRIEQSGTAAQGGLRVDAGALIEFEVGDHILTGLHLASTGRMGGNGEIRLAPGNQFKWFGGGLGVVSNVNGSPGPIDAYVINDGLVLLTGGSIAGPQSRFINQASGQRVGVLQQYGVLSLGSGSAIINRGAWTFRPHRQNIQLQGAGGQFINEVNGVVTASVESSLLSTSTTNVTFTNQGKVIVKTAATLQVPIITGIANGKLTEGEWVVEPGGTLITPQLTGVGRNVVVECNGTDCPQIHPATNEGTLRSTGNWTINDAFTNSGDFAILSGPYSVTGNVLNNGGLITITQDETLSVGMSLLNTGAGGSVTNQGGVVEVQGDIENGSGEPPSGGALSFLNDVSVVSFDGNDRGTEGYICANLKNRSSGELRPGGSGATGPFRLTGNLNLFNGSSLQIELNGLVPIDEHDQIVVNGNVTLGGTLKVAILPGYQPKGGEQFTIMTVTGGTISGQFQQISGPGQYSVTYNANSVVLTLDVVPVPGDITGDGTVNVNDLLAVINAWGACPALPATCPADISPPPNGDGVVNVNDLLMVINNWG